MNKKLMNFIFWAPRFLVICYALFLSLFAMDVFSEGHSLLNTLLALVMHLIPTFFILLILWMAWRWEWIGTVACIGLSVFYPLWTRGEFPLATYLIMTGPLMLIGLLFMLGWIYNPRKKAADGQTGHKPFLWITIVIILLIILGTVLLPGTQEPPESSSILKPMKGSEVPYQTQVMGEFTEDLYETDLWLVVQTKDSNLFHPQPGPIFKPPRRMKWYSTAYIGKPDGDDRGKPFTIYLFSATPEASQVFMEYIEANKESQLWAGLAKLPEGLTSLATVQVVRK